jgi:hypothetical protein
MLLNLSLMLPGSGLNAIAVRCVHTSQSFLDEPKKRGLLGRPAIAISFAPART